MTLLKTVLKLVPILLVAGCAAAPLPAECPQTEGPRLVVFLVRHAEKVKAGDDPSLTEEGDVRAKRLAELLADVGELRVHSTDYERTRSTARPAAEAHGATTEIYDPRDLEGFAEDLQKAGGRHLVVGHSNTTPRLVEILGGDPGSEIEEKCEYDRLYVVSISARGQAQTILLRYGQAYRGSSCLSR